ncbi:MAG: transporter [Actinomycetia bacterium]|nr:transporter [Actinomycetes bacterium]
MTEESAQVADAHVSAPDEGRLSESSRGRLIVALLSVVLLSEIIPFTYSLAIVITPLVGRSFPSVGNQVTWMITILGVVGGGTIALVTKAADLWGKKRVMLISAVVFWAGTLICAFTSNWPLFLVGRGLEAIAIGMSALGYSLVRDVFPRSWVPVTIGFIGTGIGISGVAAPLIGGVLTDHYSWRSVFWFMVIYMVVAVPLFAIFVPESKVRARQKLDILGVILIGVGLAGALVYLSDGQSWGWGNPTALAYLIGGVVLLAAFFAWEARTSNPLVDLKLVAQPKVAQIMGLSFFFTGTFTILTVAAAYMFEVPTQKQLEASITTPAYAAAMKALHATTLTPGIVKLLNITFLSNIGYAPDFDLLQLATHVLLPGSIAAMILGPASAAWARRIPARIPIIVGMAVAIAAFLGLVFLHDGWLPYTLFFVLGSIASGIYYGIGPNLLVDVVPREQQAINAGLMAGIGSIGASFATAGFTAILIGYQFTFTVNEPAGKGGAMIPVVNKIAQVYSANGYTWVFVMGAGGAVVCLLLALFLKAGRSVLQGGILE